MTPEHAADLFAAESSLDPSLFDALGVEALVPAPLAAWRPLVVDALGFFLDRLPPERLEAIVADQFALPIEAPAEARLVALLARCPTLHKLGQVLARRPELDPELRRQLQTLESMPSSRPLAPLRARIEASLGAGHGLALADAALAEGSVAVVLPFSWREAGRRREGVFKVLKPGVEAELADELALLPAVADFLETRAAALGLPALDYRGTLASVQRLLAREIRLDREQAHMAQAAAFHAADADLLVPALLPWCSPAMTAMERVFGPRLTDAELAPGQGQALADTLVRALLARPFWSGEAEAMFHGDLHGGNLLLADDGRLAVLDWSLTARLGKAEREALVAIALGAASLDASRIRAALGALGMVDADAPALAGAVERALDRLVGSGRPQGIGWQVGQLGGLALHGARGIGAQLAVFRKSWLSLAGVIRDLDAELAADLPLLGVGLQRFLAEMSARMFAAPDSRAFATHVSNADLIGLGASAWPASLRYWSRLLAGARAA